MRKLILASASPRRQALLKQMGLSDFEIRPPAQEITAAHLPPDQAVLAVAQAKGQSVTSTPGEMILAADTEVYFSGKLLGKPQSQQDAIQMLQALSGKKHTVYTGMVLLLDGREVTGVEETSVYFKTLTDTEIKRYVKSGEPMDKAGAYGIQGKAAHFIRRIEGDVYNVIGLPLYLLSELAQEMGVMLF